MDWKDQDIIREKGKKDYRTRNKKQGALVKEQGIIFPGLPQQGTKN